MTGLLISTLKGEIVHACLQLQDIVFQMQMLNVDVDIYIKENKNAQGKKKTTHNMTQPYGQGESFFFLESFNLQRPFPIIVLLLSDQNTSWFLIQVTIELQISYSTIGILPVKLNKTQFIFFMIGRRKVTSKSISYYHCRCLILCIFHRHSQCIINELKKKRKRKRKPCV